MCIRDRGKAVLDWSMEHCQSLRADTHADNKIMQHLLEKNGFTPVSYTHLDVYKRQVFGSAVLLGQGQLLVGDAGRSVRHMDDAAARKAVLFLLHWVSRQWVA